MVGAGSALTECARLGCAAEGIIKLDHPLAGEGQRVCVAHEPPRHEGGHGCGGHIIGGECHCP